MRANTEFNVFSCFDGISCGQQALVNAGVKYDKYYASEIDQRAIAVTQRRWPKTIQFGSITKIEAEHFMSPIHLLMGGSPCQGFSFAGKQLNFDDPRSKLFFEFVRLKNELQPKYFFLENVRMKKESQEIISKAMGVEPIFVNSALVSAQYRQRLYWTNIPGFVMPEDRGIILEDILQHDIKDFKHFPFVTKNTNPSGRGMSGIVHNTDRKAPCLTTNKGEGIKRCFQVGEIPNCTRRTQGAVYSPLGKINSLDTCGGGNREAKVQIITHSTQPRNGKGQGGKGHLQKEDGKTYCLDTGNTTVIEIDNQYRKLTPIEYERCFGLPDNYTKGISNSARYHALGNGWQVDTIVEFFKHIPTLF